MNFSNSTTDKTERLKDENTLADQWESIDWAQVEKEVNRLQTRIAKATVKDDKNKVKRLQYLLTHSFYAKWIVNTLSDTFYKVNFLNSTGVI